mmetsp:Transcript_13598/g.28092  ORF Transcript_13598/g.28092 Transcript_13598/m.28092 type:complete len:224 (-) Transcript_13598:121-792(-)
MISPSNVGCPCHVQDFSGGGRGQNNYRTPLARRLAVTENYRVCSSNNQRGWLESTRRPTQARNSQTVPKALEGGSVGPLCEVHHVNGLVDSYTSVCRSGCKFQSPVSWCEFNAVYRLSCLRQLSLCRPSRSRGCCVGTLLEDLCLVVRTAGCNEASEFGVSPAEHADTASVGLPFSDQIPFSAVSKIPNADESIAAAGCHPTPVDIEGTAMDVILVHGRDDLR